MRWYLDASVALHCVLEWGDPRARAWLEAEARGAVLSSTLLRLEIVRTLRRERLDTRLAALVLARLELVSLDDGVLQVAASIEPHVKALDAIHLATCSLLGAGITLVTHDGSMRQAAEQLGIETFDPLPSEQSD